MLMRQRPVRAYAGHTARGNSHPNSGGRKATAQRMQTFRPSRYLRLATGRSLFAREA
jgi:hypothetical protein